MVKRVSPLEYELRQLIIRRALPYAIAASQRVSRLAVSRFRRTSTIFRHCRGEGLEIGAAAAPSAVPRQCRVRYVDRYDLKHLESDPELSPFKLRKPDILDSAETLATIGDASQDFVIAFMVMEHVEDPIGMLAAAKRVCRPGGSIILSVPDKRYDADKDRELTTFEHLVRDYEEGVQVSHLEHFYDFGRHVKKLEGEALQQFVDEWAPEANIHYHVWDAGSYLSFLQQATQYLGGGLEIVEFSVMGHETLVALKVTGGAPAHQGAASRRARVESVHATSG